MGGLSCKFATKEDDDVTSTPSRRVKRKLTATASACPSTTAVLENYDLLQHILLKLALGNGCSLDTRLRLTQVSRLWRDVSQTLPVSLQLLKPMNDQQIDQLTSGKLSCIRHLGFSGTEELHAAEVLESQGFQQGSSQSLASLSGLPVYDNMAFLSQFQELRTVALCKRNCNKLIDIVRGRTYNLSGLKVLKKLRSLTLRDLAGPRAGLDLSQLPASLKDLHLVNTCFVHHPNMTFPEGLHLDCLTAYTIGRSVNLLPVELLKRTKQAILRGKAIHLSGKPKYYPEMEEDSMEVIINGGMIFLFAFGVAQVMHEDDASAIFQDLERSDLQVLRLCTEEGGVTSLVSRSDCRKGLRWKSAEVEDPASFMNATRATAENASRGFDCRVEDHEGFINCVCLTRVGPPEEQAKSALAHLNLQQMHIRTRMQDLEEQVNYLSQLFRWQD